MRQESESLIFDPILIKMSEICHLFGVMLRSYFKVDILLVSRCKRELPDPGLTTRVHELRTFEKTS